MPNICIKTTIEEKHWPSQNLDFLGLKHLSPGQFWGTPVHEDILLRGFHGSFDRKLI